MTLTNYFTISDLVYSTVAEFADTIEYFNEDDLLCNLGIGQLKFYNLIYAIEQLLSIEEIPESEYSKWHTTEDIIKYAERHQK